MGYYINKPKKGVFTDTSYSTKVSALIADGATQVTGDEFVPNLICVVNNGPFAAAAYCYNKAEFDEFKRPDGRTKTWLIHPDAIELSGY